jgi:hypothetical protein
VKNATAVDHINLPAYSGAQLPAKPNWSYDPNKFDSETVKMVSRLEALKDEGLTGLDLVLAWVTQRVLPLQGRPHKMCFISGRLDPSRTSRTEMTKDAVARRINSISDAALSENWKWELKPYSRDRRPPPVSFLLLSSPLPSPLAS